VSVTPHNGNGTADAIKRSPAMGLDTIKPVERGDPLTEADRVTV
jgi:hypothetical protein